MTKQRDWYQIESKKNSAEILIYEEIGQDYWGDGVSAKRFVEDLQALDVKSIVLRINSPGGSVFDGNAIYNALKEHEATINVKIDGIAASIASVVAMAGDTIEMPENAMIMIHDPSGFVMGTAEDMEKMAAALEKVKSGLIAAYHDKSNLDKDQIAEMMSAETWMTAQEAIEFGFATKITDRVNIQANMKGLSMYKNIPKSLTAVIGKTKSEQKEEETMTTENTVKLTDINLDFIKAKFPEIVTALIDEATKTGLKSGAEKERERIKAVQEQLIPGHEKLINDLMWDGETTGEQAAVQVLQAEKQVRDKVKNDITDDSPEVVEQPAVEEDTSETEDQTLPIEERAKAEWNKNGELRAEFGGDFAVYLAYEKANDIGRIKVLKSK